MTLTELRKKLPQYEIENHPYDIGYWLRVADEPRPVRGAKRQQGWDDADKYEHLRERTSDE